MLAAALSLPPLAAAGPDLVLQGLDGRSRLLNKFVGHGQWTVVAIWSTDSPICKRDMHEMGFLHAAHHRNHAIERAEAARDAKQTQELYEHTVLSIVEIVGGHGWQGTLCAGHAACQPATAARR